MSTSLYQNEAIPPPPSPSSLSLFPLLFLHSNVGGYSTNEPNQLSTRGRPNATVPRLSPIGRLKGPANKLPAIVKSEHVVIIFYIVLTE